MGKTFEDHLQNLTSVFERFREYGLKLKPRKCDFFQKEIDFLGRTINRDGMAIGSEYVEVVKKWKVPTTTREVEQFLGFANYHRTFIKNFADLSYPLYQLTGKKPYKWRDSEQEAFDQLVEALTTTPLLALPNNKDPFILDTDASNFAIGAELIQSPRWRRASSCIRKFFLDP
ncbi:Hypothetical predicted protein [Mytilus galloprovincialis]|nr:Hypothetical predicted protein [Mytilus galloprovincialis]